jgi:hypothetical protein
MKMHLFLNGLYRHCDLSGRLNKAFAVILCIIAIFRVASFTWCDLFLVVPILSSLFPVIVVPLPCKFETGVSNLCVAEHIEMDTGAQKDVENARH